MLQNNIPINKKKLIDGCFDYLQQQYNLAKQCADEIQEQINDYGPNKDRYDSFRTKLMRSKEMYFQQMENTANQIKTLTLIDFNKKYSEVEFGAIVVTDVQNYFIATGIGKIMIEDSNFLVISVTAPLFSAMRNKQPNDVINFNGIKQKIKTIL